MSRLDDVKPVGYSYRGVLGDMRLSTESPQSQWGLTNIEPLYTREQLIPKVRFPQDR